MRQSTPPKFAVEIKDWEDFAKQIGAESDRGAALVATAFLDHLLGALIESFLLDDASLAQDLLRGPLAPLGGLASKTMAAYALGLISDDERHDIDLMREVRNRFAHRLSLDSFDSPEVADFIRSLTVPALARRVLPNPVALSPRQLFVNTAAMLSTFLDKRRRMATDRRSSPRKFHLVATGGPA